VHVEGVLLDAGDALGEPTLLVVSAAVGEHPHRRRCSRHLRRLMRWIWSASQTASGRVGSRVGYPEGRAGLVWIWIDASVVFTSVRRAYFIFFFPFVFMRFDRDELTRLSSGVEGVTDSGLTRLCVEGQT
jgi:hypothetical protein